eukprot:2817244-Lingulodinium_polyedra.AAC.1
MAYALEPLDVFVAARPAVSLDVYVDDATTSAEGTAEHVVAVLPPALAALKGAIEGELGGGFCLGQGVPPR